MDDTLDLMNTMSSVGGRGSKSSEKNPQSQSNNAFLDPFTPPRDKSGYVDPQSWNKPPSRQGKGQGKGSEAPPTPPGRLPHAMPPTMSIPRATGGGQTDRTPPHYPVAQATHAPSERQPHPNYSRDDSQQHSTGNPFVDYSETDPDIVFITDSPERRTESSPNRFYDGNQNNGVNGNSGWGGGGGGNGGAGNGNGGGPGGWWRNMRNRNSGKGQASDEEPYVNRVSLGSSTVALDGTGELLLATGEGGDGSELGMVREDQPHLVLSLLQARNMIPPSTHGRTIQRFTAYFVVNYGGFERKTSSVLCPSGAAIYDQHMVFPAIGEATDLVISLMSKGNLVDKCLATLTLAVPPVFGRRATRTARATLESSGGFGVVLESEEGAKMNSPLCHAEWFALDSTTAQAVLAEVNLSVTPTFFRQLPSVLEVSRSNREERCRVVRELEDLTTHCLATELLPRTANTSEMDMSSSSAALAEEMQSLKLEVWRDESNSQSLFEVNLGGSDSESAAPLTDASCQELKAYFAVLLGRVRKHLHETTQRGTHATSMASVQAVNKQLRDMNNRKSSQLELAAQELASTRSALSELLVAVSSEAMSLEATAESAMQQGAELWSLTVLLNTGEGVVVRLSPDHKILHVIALVNGRRDSKVISLTKENGAALDLGSTLRACVSPGATLTAIHFSLTPVLQVEEELILEVVEMAEETAASDTLHACKEEVLRMRRELATWMKAQKQWAAKESELVKRVEESEREKMECSSALAQARTVTSKMEAVCAGLSERASLAEGKASRTGAALDNVLAQLSCERSNASATASSFSAERREMMSLIEASLDPNLAVQRVDSRQRELQRRIAVEDSRQHQMSEQMGMGPVITPEKERQMRERAYEASSGVSGGMQEFSEVDLQSDEEPSSLKEYYEQKRKLRERMRGGKPDVGSDGLRERKGQIKMHQNTPNGNIDWSGY